MTAPSGDQGQQQSQQPDQGGKGKAPAAKVKPLDVVQYTHRDPILLGREHQAVGVVSEVAEGGQVHIRPLQGHTVQVDPSDIAGVISADDV